MFMRIDKLLTDIPMPKGQDPNAGSALQELLGGKYGEMSTLNNYMFQSFNFRNRSKLDPSTTSSPASPPRSLVT